MADVVFADFEFLTAEKLNSIASDGDVASAEETAARVAADTALAATSAGISVRVTALENASAGLAAIIDARIEVSMATVTPLAFPLTNSDGGNVTNATEVLVPFSGTRKWLYVANDSTGAEKHYLGSADVLVGRGIPVSPGGGFLFSGGGAAGPIYGITTVASSPFTFAEG